MKKPNVFMRRRAAPEIMPSLSSAAIKRRSGLSAWIFHITTGAVAQKVERALDVRCKRVDELLQQADDVVSLPQIGNATYETRNQMARLTAENIAAILAGKELLTPV